MKRKTLDIENQIEENESKRSKSFFIYYIDLFFEFCYTTFFLGFFGKIFTSYSKAEHFFDNSFIISRLIKNKKTKNFFRKIREFLSKGFANSFFIRKLGDLIKILLSIPLRSYGNFVFSFGIYTVLIYFINMFIYGMGSGTITNLYVGLVMCVVSIPLIMSSSTLAMAVYTNRITHFIFVKLFYFKEEAFEYHTPKIKHHSNIMIFLGMAFGIISFFIPPLSLILGLSVFILGVLIVITPEVGILISLLLLPFFSFFEFPTLSLVVLVLTTTLSFIIKVIRGKRILKFRLIDVFVLIFTILLYFSGWISIGGALSFYSMLVSCALMLGYFLVVNLIRSTEWLKRCIFVLTSSAVIVSVIGIAQYILGYIETSSFDNSYFKDIDGRVVSVFENANVLGCYLVMILPFVIAMFINSLSKYSKRINFLAILLMITCIILTWSRGAWLAMIIGVFILLFLYSRKSGRILIFSALALPFTSFLIPNNILTRLSSIGDLADSSTMYRVYTWKGTLTAISDNLFSGFGYGADAFSKIYPQFAYAGIEAAEHSHNLFLQIIFSMGIVGIIVFGIIIFLTFQQNLEYIKNTNNTNDKLFVIAIFSSLISALIMGMFDYIWYNYRVFFTFWIIIAMASSYFRIKDDEEQRKRVVFDTNKFSAEAEINV